MSKSYPLITVGNGKATHRSDNGTPYCVAARAHRPTGATISRVAAAARKQVRPAGRGIPTCRNCNVD